MKGVIFNIVEDTITEHLGHAAWDDLLDDAGIDHGHTALGNYSDDEMMALVAAAAVTLGKTHRHVMCWVGARAIPYFVKRYPDYFDQYGSAFTLLPALDGIIHPEVRKLYSDARPPGFDTAASEDRNMTVIYTSHRLMCGLAEGLMQGIADHYGESMSIAHPECIETGGVRCRFELEFA